MTFFPYIRCTKQNGVTFLMVQIDAFLDYLRYERCYSEDTLKAYQEDLEQFVAYGENVYKELTPDRIDAGLVRDWVTELMDRGYAPASVNRKLSTLRSFFRFLLRKGEVEKNPLRKVVGPKRKKALPVFIKEQKMDQLLDETDFGEGYKGCRDRMIVEMFYETGIRLSELIGLNDVDVDFSESQIKVTGKRNKQRLIPFGEGLKESMLGYLSVRNEAVPIRTGAFFLRENGERLTRSIVENVVKRSLSKVTTAKRRSPHVLRHTFATIMLNHNAELGAIKELLGHESLATTEVYTHVSFEDLKKVYNQAHPRA